MDLIIKYQCPMCAVNKIWVYREEEGLLPRGFPGCPGGCQATHHLSVTEITDDLDEERAQRELDSYPSLPGK